MPIMCVGTVFALGFMTIAKKGKNDFTVTSLPQAEPGFIPPGGVGKTLTPEFRPKFMSSGSGSAAEIEAYKITVSTLPAPNNATSPSSQPLDIHPCPP
jgi:hypothetical protein